MDIKDKIAHKAIEAGGRLRVKSALNPILWLCAIVTVPGLGYLIFTEKEVPLLMQIFIFSPVFSAILGFIFLLFFDRDKLQSEDYQIRKRTLELVQEKGDSFPVIARTLEVVTNPVARRLEHNEEESSE
ncbi:hypothetical protein K6U56_01540 [Vibrio furnissii]|uniref:hypothetical protein n=1 Tax=Vibrio furnissii TaxID=29494 RepID=UPI001302152C|nr:hypothetical protein [Vibrio furnissii]EKO3475611.1 hypothetical protein [Vibrio fluvialis]EKO3952242.1 hypothetical protein [Vibrio fluvialis]EKO3999066.1 hypothetical protein [Vibrio fluvialis]MCG6210652.1 hypothetical protein [Vibrio furnissii]